MIEPPPLCILALSDTDQPMLVWWIILGLIALGPALHSWIKVVEFFKGKKFDVSNYVTHAQLAAVKTERDEQIKASIAGIKDDLDTLRKTLADIARDLPAIHRALGRLEGHDDNEKPIRRAR